MLLYYPTCACAARGKVIKFVCLSFFLSAKKLAWTSHFQDFWAYQKVKKFLSYLPVPATGLTCSHSLGFLLFSYYPVHFVSHFIYGHESRPQLICHMFTYIHAHAQQLTLHSGSRCMNESWTVQSASAQGMCSVELSFCLVEWSNYTLYTYVCSYQCDVHVFSVKFTCVLYNHAGVFSLPAHQ